MLRRSKQTIVVVGFGRAGQQLVSELTHRDRAHRFDIAIFDAAMKRRDPGTERLADGVVLHRGERVIEVNSLQKEVITDDERRYRYDHLILATGAALVVPEIEGDEKGNVIVYRTLEDIVAVKSYAETCQKVVVCGEGRLGMEAASACADFGLETTLLSCNRYLEGDRETGAGRSSRNTLASLGVTVRTDARPKCFAGNGKATCVRLIGDALIPADLVVLAAEEQPNVFLARQAGVSVADFRGIQVDDVFRTSEPDIYAFGSCTGIGAAKMYRETASKVARALYRDVTRDNTYSRTYRQHAMDTSRQCRKIGSVERKGVAIPVSA